MNRAPFLLLGIALLVLASNAWGAIVCGDNVHVPDSGNTVNVVQLSRMTNAHAEVPGGTQYTATHINCTATPPTPALSNTNNLAPLFYLNANTNAHASLTTDSYYPIPITLGIATGVIDVKVADSGAGESCATFNTSTATYNPLIRLADTYNAHVQSPNYAGQYPYPYIVCLAELPSGTQTDTGDIISMSQDGLPATFQEGTPATLTIHTNNLKVGDPLYTNVSTLRVTAVCNRAIPGCDDIDTYTEMRALVGGYITGTVPSYLIAGSVRATNHGSTYPVGPIPTINASNLDGQATTNDTYDLGPGNVDLPAGSYRVMTIDYRAQYIFNGGSSGSIEGAGLQATNAAFTDITITPSGNGGGGQPNADGDVYIMKKITFPNLYSNQNIDVTFDVENENVGLVNDNRKIFVIIRDSDGNPVPPFDITNPQSVEMSPCDASEITNNTCTKQVSLTIQNAGLTYLQIGRTYTLYGTVDPYVDPTTPANSERITKNNSGLRTFTVIEPSNTFAIPDNNPLLAAFMTMIVMGWLFAATRKK